MIRGNDIENVCVMASNNYEEYEKLANNSVDDEALYEFLKGFADASNIARRIMWDNCTDMDGDRFEELCDKIKQYAGFRCTSKKGKDRDCLKNFKKGREAGCNVILEELEQVKYMRFVMEDA